MVAVPLLVMKICGYCGRENDDAAVVCRECGLSEFSEDADEKAQTSKVGEIPEVEFNQPVPDVAADQEAAICPFCLFPNLPDREWCKQCGSPFNTSALGPFESALAAGSMWRGAVRGRPKRFVLLVCWIFFFPVCCISLWAALAAPFFDEFPSMIVCLAYAAIHASMLYQVTRNYVTLPKVKFDQ